MLFDNWMAPVPERLECFFMKCSVMRAVILGGFLLLPGFHASRVLGQGISPVIVEYQGKAKGSFEVRNDSIYPLSVVLEPMSFTVDGEGNPHYRALDSGIHLRCSATSFRVPPKQIHTVYYEANTEQLPAWFTIYATIGTGRVTQAGVQVAIQLPHTVYLLPKQKFERNSVVFLRSEVMPGQKKVAVELQNGSQLFARVQEVELNSTSGKKTYAGFPFFPGQLRKLELDWDRVASPNRVVLKFEKFKVSSDVRVSQ